MVKDADAFVYGSLAARNGTSRDTLFHLLEKSKYCVMDLNLRPPHVDVDYVLKLISRADLLKVNHEELMQLHAWLNGQNMEESQVAEQVMQRFGIKELIVTKGAAGSVLYKHDSITTVVPPKVKVVDTVGSGDAFLAGYLAKKMRGEGGETAMKFASSLAAIVAGSSGACPDYVVSDIRTNF